MLGFEDAALPPMIKLRQMWSEMMDPELVELTTKAFANTMELKTALWMKSLRPRKRNFSNR